MFWRTETLRVSLVKAGYLTKVLSTPYPMENQIRFNFVIFANYRWLAVTTMISALRWSRHKNFRKIGKFFFFFFFLAWNFLARGPYRHNNGRKGTRYFHIEPKSTESKSSVSTPSRSPIGVKIGYVIELDAGYLTLPSDREIVYFWMRSIRNRRGHYKSNITDAKRLSQFGPLPDLRSGWNFNTI